MHHRPKQKSSNGRNATNNKLDFDANIRRVVLSDNVKAHPDSAAFQLDESEEQALIENVGKLTIPVKSLNARRQANF
jgi:hypothetical protein